MKIFLMMSLLTFSSVAVGGQAWDVSKTTTSHADAPGDACEQAEAIARLADGVVVGSAIVALVAANLGGGRDKVVAEVLALTRTLAGSTHAARRGKVPA